MQWWNAIGSALNLTQYPGMCRKDREKLSLPTVPYDVAHSNRIMPDVSSSHRACPDSLSPLQYPTTDRGDEENQTSPPATPFVDNSNRTTPNTSSSHRACPNVFALGHFADDCWLACMPLFHIGGLAILFRSVISGISILLHEKFAAQAVNKAIKEERVTIISVVALMLQRMLAALDDEQNNARYPATLRCVLLGGGPAPLPLLEDRGQAVHHPLVQAVLAGL